MYTWRRALLAPDCCGRLDLVMLLDPTATSTEEGVGAEVWGRGGGEGGGGRGGGGGEGYSLLISSTLVRYDPFLFQVTPWLLGCP